MSAWILTIEALDGAGSAQTLRFTDSDYIDPDANYYEPRLLQPASIVVSPNDGGVLNLFKAPSIGEIELANIDGGLNYLADYAVDGRAMALSFVEGAAVTPVLSGTVDRMTEGKGIISLAIKSLTEALTAKHPQDVYAGTGGLEGGPDDLAGNVKPKVFGRCFNLSPDPVNEALLIYEASSRADCIIAAVYDNGVRLTNYLVKGAHSAGATSIHVDSGVGAIPAGSRVMFGGRIYSVATGLSGGVIVLSSGVIGALVDNQPMEVVNYYTGSGSVSGELQNTNASYLVNGAHAIGATTINVDTGNGGIPTGSNVRFGNLIYTVATGLSGGVIVLSSGLTVALLDNSPVDTFSGWSSYNGYFRLASTPAGLITCDVITHTGYVEHKAGDVFSTIAAELGISVDSGSVTYLNATAYVGIYLDSETSSKELFDLLARSVCGYYYYVGATLYMGRLVAPTPAASIMTIEPWNITRIERLSTGCGSNGIPIYGISLDYQQRQTRQQTVAGSVSTAWAALLRKGFRVKQITDAAVLSRHPLSEKLSITTALTTEAEATAVATQCLGVVKVRRDVVEVTAHFSQIPAFSFGATVLLRHDALGYAAGRYMIIVGYELDINRKSIVLRVFG